MANLREITLAAAAARVAGAPTTGDTIAVDHWDKALFLCVFTDKKTDSGDTCDVYVDVSPDGGTTWLNAVHFTQALGNGTDAASEYAVLYANTPGTSIVVATADAASTAVRPTLFGNALRARWAIVNSGTDDESFTFSVTAILQ
jgi:GrpB-like predicted nucleotidyltransferase (UPF0157 family)